MTVNTLVDENNGIGVGAGNSLREVVFAAPAGETIDFSVTGTINLTLGEILINKNLTILGPGANLLTIDASGSDPTPAVNNGDGSRIFHVDDGGSGLIDVIISGLTLTGGDSSGRGGAIFSFENLAIGACTLTGNAAVDGGAIAIGEGNVSVAGETTITQCTISGNTATDSGGGISSFTRDITIENSTISGNTAAFSGGGINDEQLGFIFQTDHLTILGSTISGNSTTAGFSSGGGLSSGNKELTITDCIIDGNSAANGAGIVADDAEPFNLINSDVTNNVASDSGGGIYLLTVFNDAHIVNSRINGNSAVDFGGGILHGGGVGGPNQVLTIDGSQIIGNSVSAADGLGAGIHSAFEDLTITDSTISGNLAPGSASEGGEYDSMRAC